MAGKSGQQHPSISAAFTRNMPERLLGTEEKEPALENGSEEVSWSVHDAAKEAAKRGRTLMVFMQADNRSVPYDEYRRHLDAGGLPIGTPKPVPLKIEAGDDAL